ncbi:MAG: CHAP domain-containing protein [Clostridia bacterium]|nr:CHAP domain-containing protein [Clostridia bacterium]
MKTNTSKARRLLTAVLAVILVSAIVSPASSALTYSGSSSYKSGPYYKKLCAVELTGDPRTDLVNVARSQVGYFEGNDSSQLSGTVNGKNNYTEYGRWYEMQDMWCAIFVSWCAYVAGIPTSVIPKHAYTPSGLSWFQSRNQAYSRESVEAGEYTPQPGDIIYYKSPRNSNPTNHVGIVTGYSAGTIYTIEGNTSSETVSTNGGTVAEKSYQISNTYIVYVCRPNYETGADGSDIVAWIDDYGAVSGGVKIRGWCFDRNHPDVSLQVHVYFGGAAGSASAEGDPNTVANTSRPDVDNVYHTGKNHGYDSTVYTTKKGSIPVYVYAVNPNNGESVLIKSFTADVGPKPGDVNKDGKVNNKDVVALFRYVSEGQTGGDPLIYDLNGDGKINNKDVLTLFRTISAA